MGLQPIDLSVMYQQSSNVARLASSAQTAQLADSINQQTTVVQQNLEESRRVQQSSDENTKVGDRDSNGQGYGASQNKEGDQNNRNPEEDQESGNAAALNSNGKRYIGTIIDIVG